MHDHARSVLDLLRTRASVRRYAPDPVDRATLETLLEAAARAPSAHNRQPWRFAVLGPAARERLAHAMAAELRRDRLADGDAPDAVEADAARSIARITGAGAAVLVALTLQDMDRYPDAKRADAESLMAEQSVAAACTTLLLAAHALGLGGAWMCAPLFCAPAVRQALELPADFAPRALVTLGRPLAPPAVRERRPLASVTRWLD